MLRKIDYQKELNPKQREAVFSTEGPHLVIAGAGSGKTRVLVYRVAYLVEKGINPEELLLLTFTRKAAAEMLRRASSLLDERCNRVSGGTFHSFANIVLRKYAPCLGLAANFTILDRSDAEDTINLIRTKLGFHKSKECFPRKGTLCALLSKSINKSESIKNVLSNEYARFMEWEGQIIRIKDEYAAYKSSKSLLDYDDLLVYLRKLLLEFDQIRLVLAKKYRYIMVDEYQDTNKLQAQIIGALASESKNIMAVGDDAQSIYAFRGANFKNIIDFPVIFKGAKLITLEENYRSTQPILNLTNEIIRQAEEGFEKMLYTRNPGDRLPVYIEMQDEHKQSEYVADKILALREEGLELSDMAVLFRSGWHSNDLEVELASRGIPFVKYGGQKFVEAAHVKDMLSYLRIVQNAFDHVSWYRLLLLMPGIGPKTAEAIIRQVVVQKSGFTVDSKAKIFSKTHQLAALFKLFNEIAANHYPPAEMLEICIEHYHPLLKEKYDDFDKRLKDIDSLVRIARRYRSLERFLTDMALEPPERNIVEAGLNNDERTHVSLSTIHSAKGLEWHTVFIIYLAEGHLPSYLSLEDSRQIEEERRLLYVAATRARENLFLLKPHIDRSPWNYFSKTNTVFTRPSRFLDENILGKFTSIESYPGKDSDALSANDIIEKKPGGASRAFLETIGEYFESGGD
ncbi:MAG: ATP-dependent helicase [Patescibacteria group bacterium]